MTATLAAQNLHRVCPDSVVDERVPEKALPPLCEGFTSPGPGYGLDVEQEQERVKELETLALGKIFASEENFFFSQVLNLIPKISRKIREKARVW